jgi:outer membrane protein assembly factor BamE (lipoprotein component of BamABCDE complex)
MPSAMRSPKTIWPGGNGRGKTCRAKTYRAKALAAALVLSLSLPLGGCLAETYQKGYVVPEGALEQIPIGASQEQVLIVLGTPSTVATVSGEVFYYISQRSERRVAFLQQEVVDQRVVAVYFDKSRRVERLANYGMKDGRIFDYVSRTTPTTGRELSYISTFFQVFTWKP